MAVRWSAWLLVALAAAAIWCWHYDRWSASSWGVPTNYSGDAHEILARVQAAAEGDIWPGKSQIITRLGAPFGARWNGYPSPDKLLMLAVGGMSRLTGLFVATNVALLLAQVSAALAFYCVARSMRARWEWAVAGALLFAYTYTGFYRGLAHFSLIFTWTVPLGLFAVWLVAGSRRLEWNRPGAIACLGAAAALGVHNPYNLFFWLQLMAWALVAQWLGARRRANLQIGMASVGVAVALFVVTNVEVWLHVDEPEGAPLLARNYGGTERFALKPVELFIPPATHRWEPLAFLGGRYLRWSEWRGEGVQPYLGLIGIAGLAWLAVLTARQIFNRRALPGPALACGWLLAYASVGGVTNLLAFFGGLQIFRATNRVGIFISGIILFFLVIRLSRVTARWPRGWRVGAAFAIATLGILDQVPRRSPAALFEATAATVAADRAFGQALEAAVPAGAMVFQLPVQGFPEVVPPGHLTDYELFRPYLATHTLRFSYGAAKFRARSRWQRDLEGLPASELVPQLERYGFAVLFINRKGFPDRAEGLLNELAALGYHRRFEGAGGNQIAVLLNPAVPGEFPLARTMSLGRGWHQAPVDGVRWAFEDAVLSYHNPFAVPLTVDLQLPLRAVGPRDLTLLHEDRVVGTIKADVDERPLTVSGLKLAPGVNRFRLQASEEATRSGSGRYQLRSFGLTHLSLRIRPAPMQRIVDAK